ncbi:Uncharacterised protein [Mycobacterium tuberculosis]|nr:Uncharacterised protein [Mycobacterium tuberculosis]
MQCRGNLPCDREATPGQAEHNHVRLVPIGGE